MFIAGEPWDGIQAPSGAALVRVEFVAMPGFLALISMPLPTELVSTEDGFCYRHDAPNGAIPTGQLRFRLVSRRRTTSGRVG